MKIKKDLEISTDDFWYDLTDGGYLNPHNICEHNEDAICVENAIHILSVFRDSCEEQIEGFTQ